MEVFRFNFEPGENGKYHEITAVGMENVTAGFGEYNLKEIAQEFRDTASLAELEYVLPETVGGTKVHLLLGIKNTRIQPTLIRVLPSGVGVYLSPFKDVWGSRIIFVSPNKVFTQANREQQRDSNHAVCVFDLRDQMIETSDSMQSRKIRFDSIGKIKTSLYSSQIEDEILQEMGFKPVFDLEKLVDEPEFLANFLVDDNRNHFC